MGTARLISISDTHIGQDQPTTNYNLGASLYIRQFSGSIRVGYLYFTRPFPLGATITSAKLHLYGYAKPVAGTIQLYLRRLNQTINYGTVTWNTRATAFAYPEVYSSKSGTYPDREEYEFDITTQMQAVSGGAKWYGYQLGSDWATETWSPRFMSVNHPNPDLRPWVEVTWSDAPAAPTQLGPTAGRVVSIATPVLRFNYSDVAGDTDLNSAQVQINTTSTFTTPLYDSGEQPVDGAQWDLTPTAFTATEGTLYYWRVRVQDGAGLWSAWSAAASFVYRPLPTFEIQNPPLPPNNFVEEPTPPITWNVLTGTQAAYALSIYRRNEADTAWVAVFARGRTVSATADGFSVPAGIITVKDETYLVNLRVWDGYDREAVANGPDNRLMSREFTYEFSALTSPVTNLTAVGRDPRPGMWVEWDRATAPDSYSIIRDGVVIAANLDPDDDTFDSGIHNKWQDRTPVKGQAHVYSVQAIVGGKASDANPEVTATNEFPGTWLLDGDGNRMTVIVADQGRTMEYVEQSEVYEPLGSTRVALVTQGLRGYQGTIAGEFWQLEVEGLRTIPGKEWRDHFLVLKSWPGQTLYLFTDSETMPIVMQNATAAHLPGPDGDGYSVSFQFFQIDNLPFTPHVGWDD